MQNSSHMFSKHLSRYKTNKFNISFRFIFIFESLQATQQQVNRLEVDQLNAERLLPTRYKTKKAILSIDSTGRVIVELIRFKSKLKQDRVVDVCRISRDGARIEIYQPDPGR